jgi:opacity protein-like surface antigen
VIKAFVSKNQGGSMKTFKKCLLALVLMATVTSGAQASLLIEPHLGYNISGTGDFNNEGIPFEIDYNGAQYGLKAGWQLLGFMVGLDYTLSNPEVETSAAGFSGKDKFDTKELGVFAGYNLPILLRAWAGYYFDVTAETSGTGAYEAGTELSGHTMELGIGFTGLPLVSLNLIYRNKAFDEVKDSTGTTKLSGTQEVKASEIVLGVSLPLTL